MGISFEEAIKNNIITPQNIQYIPTKCKCGANLEFSESFKHIQCTSENCKMIIVNRIENICSKIGMQFNQSDILKIVDKLKLITPYQILMLDKALEEKLINKNEIQSLTDNIQILKEFKDKEYYIYNIAELCGIEDISKVAIKIFDGFESFEDAFEEIEIAQVSFINERLGIKSSDSSILSVDIFNKLIALKEELIFGETQLNIKRYKKKLIKISFCDNVLPFINKSELLNYLNYKFDYKFSICTAITESTDILIKNADGNNNKYRSAKLINDKYIADSMNKGELVLNDIGKFKNNQLKPIGSSIYIDTLENVINRLHSLESSDT